DPEHRGRGVDTAPSHVDLVTPDRLTERGAQRATARGDTTSYADGLLTPRERGHDRQEPQTRRRRHGGFDAVGILERVPEHLITAAESNHRRAGARRDDERVGDAPLTEPAQIGHRALASWHDDQIGAREL